MLQRVIEVLSAGECGLPHEDSEVPSSLTDIDDITSIQWNASWIKGVITEVELGHLRYRGLAGT
jgi:hypothetical protein